MLISIETHRTCDFPEGGVRTPYPPSGSALDTILFNPSRKILYFPKLLRFFFISADCLQPCSLINVPKVYIR